jgi:hypothetical protein
VDQDAVVELEEGVSRLFSQDVVSVWTHTFVNLLAIAEVHVLPNYVGINCEG